LQYWLDIEPPTGHRPLLTSAAEGLSLAGDRTLRLAAVICAAILTLAALWAAHAVMAPVAFSLFIMALSGRCSDG
jgi:hypothetical protein